jgi:hypothetical protein
MYLEVYLSKEWNSQPWGQEEPGKKWH